jgi:hypothetical protein
MHSEIEKLINLALVDGQITEKERNLILKKATDLGVDTIELEMYIEAKKHLHERNILGSQIKCPSCGNKLSGLLKTCPCGYVFNTGSIQESKSLESAIETLENLIIQVRGLSSSTSKEVINSLIARVEKEIRYIKTRYSDNVEVKKLLSELEVISKKYITKAVKKKNKRTLIIRILVLNCILGYGYIFIKNRMIESKSLTQSTIFNNKLDSITNPKLKVDIQKLESYYTNWENFKEKFFESYPDYGDGYVNYYSTKYKFNEKTSYKIAENQFSLIQKKFTTPIDFILYDDRNDFRNLESTSRIDSTFILTLISKSRWQLKKEIDEKIKIIQNPELQEDLIFMNDIDSIKQARLLFWNNEIKNFILNEQCGLGKRMGWVDAIRHQFQTDRQTATNYCEERLIFFEKKFKRPIDFYCYLDYLYYNNVMNDKDDLENINACEKKFKLTSNEL